MTYEESPRSLIPFSALHSTDLVIDARYDGGGAGTIADDPLARLLPVGNQGGFRAVGSVWKATVRLAVLFSTPGHTDWPDYLDKQTGLFTYYGDNRHPGRGLHETTRGGNLLLRDTFSSTHSKAEDRRRVAPFLIFEKEGSGRRIVFRGLAAPGAADLTSDEDLVAIWRSTNGERFQNYQSRFTVLDVPRVSRVWLSDVIDGIDPVEAADCPTEWRKWAIEGIYKPLTAPSTTVVRTKASQLPEDSKGLEMLSEIRNHFRGREHAFESCAVGLWRLLAPATGRCDVTRPSRDGGRDAIGEYVVGPPSDPIGIDFALEAKCYSEGAVGIRETSRLISRLRYRNFGVLVTTTYVDKTAYQEIRDDRHPIAIVSGRDIVETLRSVGITDLKSLRGWLEQF